METFSASLPPTHPHPNHPHPHPTPNPTPTPNKSTDLKRHDADGTSLQRI